MKLDVVGKAPIDVKNLEKVAEAAFSFLPAQNGQIELKFTSDLEIQALNNQYRDKDYVTDVLSFNVSDSPFLGQVFICYNKAVEQAVELHHSIEEELAVLLIHGILHVFGYDHMTDADFSEMNHLEQKIIEKITLEG